MSELTGTSRFTLRRRLGSGGMGVVWLAHDGERGVDVALKTLARVDARGIAGLKNEFRALSDLAHPNLVVLHELFFEEGQWFFTMEVVDGISFLAHVNPAAASADPGLSTAMATVTNTPRSDPPRGDVTVATLRSPSGKGSSPRVPPRGPCDIARLRPALRQLAEAVAALHAAGKLHRDLKPSNVLVTPEGRVVILDFGLAVLHGERRAEPSSGSRLLEGTPGYMAPEQTVGGAVTPASDWYAVGAMLYEALTGRLPFVGDIRQVLRQKRVATPLPPAQIAAGAVPEDLDRLCVELLRIAPETRPTGAEVLERLGARERAPASSAGAPRPHPAPAGRGTPPFVGRAAHLAVLAGAFAAARQGRATTVHVRGRSGMGKSALVEHFLDDVWQEAGALVLSGRCYERESVPYKAWDSLIDALARHLCRLPYEEARALAPAHAGALARIFPVLNEVEAIEEQTEVREASATPPSTVGGLESRRRAFDALEELLRGLARRRPLVLHLDDLQWGDVDSAKLLANLLAPPDPPPLLVVCSYRSEEALGSEFLRELKGPETAARGLAEAITLDVDRLSDDEAEALAQSLLGDPVQADPTPERERRDALARTIAREAEGSPFFVTELIRSIQDDGETSPASAERAFAGISLEAVLRARVARLDEGARRLLTILAVAARPIEQGLCARAAEVEAPDAALGALRAAHLIRSRGLRPRDLAEPYHDRVREVVVKGLDPEALRRAHLRLARALEAGAHAEGPDGISQADAEELAAHYEGAGDRGRAAVYAVQAARNATAALAFDRAARLYRLALSLGAAPTAAERAPLRSALADALINAGRGAEAAPVLLTLAEEAPPEQALEQRRRAAEQLLVSGHIDRGTRVLRGVLASVGVDYPETQTGATVALLARQARIRVRGTRFEERPVREIDPAALQRIDACFSAGKGLSLVDPVRGLGFQTQHLLLSLQAGDPRRVCLGLGFHAVTLCLGGGGGPHARRILAQATSLAERLADPYLLGVIGNCTAATHMCQGRWKATIEASRKANDLLRRECSGVAWEIETGVVFTEVSLLWMGRLAELQAFARNHVREALDHGDLFAATYARMHTWYAPVAADDPARAAAEMRDAIARWTRDGFHIMHFWALYGETAAQLYGGDAVGARARLAARWPALSGSNVLRVQFHRVWMTLLRGATTLGAAAAARGAERSTLLREADATAARLGAEEILCALPGGSLVRAGALALRGRREEALPHLDAAIAGFDVVDMSLHAACARRRKGEILGGDEGRALVAGADAVMIGEGIARPDRWAAMVAPGF